MFVVKEVLIVFGVCALTIGAYPDKMEVNVPNYSYERESGEYQANMTQEAAFWQGQGDKLGDKEEEGHQQLDQDRDKNQENYDEEKDHYQEQQHNYQTEINETYQEDIDKAQAHHETNQEHYTQYYNDTNYELSSQGNKTAEDLTETEIGDRYEEKGTEFLEDGQDKMENYDVNGDSPSITFTRT